jgi:predicted flap endonuclease-1-like 5' DNA nuclease
MTSRMRESVEKAAHVAVGAPVAAIKAMSARVSDLREAVRTSREEMGQELAKEMDEWVAEGERVIDRAMKRVRSSDVAEDVQEGVEATREAAEAGITKAKHRVERGLAPDKELTVVNGIGPSYATQLDDAGISGVVGFMSATGTKEDIAGLAETTEFTPATLESWRKQLDLTRVDGVGGSYKELLHRIDIWTMSQLADADPEAIVEKMGKVEDMPGAPEQMPSIYAVKQWVTEAKKLAK